MADQYQSVYQPNINKQEITRMGAQVGRNILERVIVYGYQGIKFVYQFIVDALHSVIGH